MKRQLAEADAALEARKKPAEETGPKIIGEGLVIDEWVSLSLVLVCKSSNILNQTNFTLHVHFHFVFVQKERRERYLAKQQVEGVDSV